IDEVIALIRAAPDAETARNELTGRKWPAHEVESFISLIDDPGHQVIDGHYVLSETQARAILELRLQRLTGMERHKLAEETQELADKIKEYLSILSSRDHLTQIMLEELTKTRALLDDPRRTEISDHLGDQDDEDLIPVEDMVVTVSHRGYIKRVPLSDYRAQRRGGKGRAGMKTRDEDFVTRLFIANTHTPILFFTSTGLVYQLKCYKLPLAAPQAQGKAMVNLLPITPDETIQTVMPMPEDKEQWDIMNVVFATANGNIRRNMLSDFTNIKRNGKIAMKLAEGDQLISVQPCYDDAEVLLATSHGKAIRFGLDQIRVFRGRDSTGVRGIRLKEDDKVVSMSILDHAQEQFVLAVTENGYGKRTRVSDYRVTNRGGQGVANIVTSPRNGNVVASFAVTEDDQLMLATDMGKVIRIRVSGDESDQIRVAGRQTQGVTLFSIDSEEKVVSVGLIQEKDTGEDDPDDIADTPSTDPSDQNDTTEHAEPIGDNQENGAET
ncbi:MAG: DNA gyrase C-terminal beta-propeller domain-containing protein, partial [Candidatus Puniceispirillales bacterium]